MLACAHSPPRPAIGPQPRPIRSSNSYLKPVRTVYTYTCCHHLFSVGCPFSTPYVRTGRAQVRATPYNSIAQKDHRTIPLRYTYKPSTINPPNAAHTCASGAAHCFGTTEFPYVKRLLAHHCHRQPSLFALCTTWAQQHSFHKVAIAIRSNISHAVLLYEAVQHHTPKPTTTISPLTCLECTQNGRGGWTVPFIHPKQCLSGTTSIFLRSLNQYLQPQSRMTLTCGPRARAE